MPAWSLQRASAHQSRLSCSRPVSLEVVLLGALGQHRPAPTFLVSTGCRCGVGGSGWSVAGKGERPPGCPGGLSEVLLFAGECLWRELREVPGGAVLAVEHHEGGRLGNGALGPGGDLVGAVTALGSHEVRMPGGRCRRGGNAGHAAGRAAPAWAMWPAMVSVVVIGRFSSGWIALVAIRVRAWDHGARGAVNRISVEIAREYSQAVLDAARVLPGLRRAGSSRGPCGRCAWATSARPAGCGSTPSPGTSRTCRPTTPPTPPSRTRRPGSSAARVIEVGVVPPVPGARAAGHVVLGHGQPLRRAPGRARAARAAASSTPPASGSTSTTRTGRPMRLTDAFAERYAEAARGRRVKARLVHPDPPPDAGAASRGRSAPRTSTCSRT